MSTTAIGKVTRTRQAGERLPGPWLLDNEGRASTDSAVMNNDPPGSILPLAAY
jgi:LDH2 family malate/lactate/ureidoglycolate dehydrogenase